MFDTFYNETLRNTVIAFGSLFNEIYVVRKNSSNEETSRFKVPITYAEKEKFIRMFDEYSKLKSLDNPRDISEILPRIGFAIETLSYDAERKRNTLSKRYLPNNDRTKIDYEYAEVPYIMDFIMTIAARSMEDGLQILEQIIAYFTPEFTVSVNFTDTRTRMDIPITLTGVSPEVDYEGTTSTQRAILLTLTFSARTYLFGPKKTGKVITTTTTNLFGSLTDTDLQGVTGITTDVFGVSSVVTSPTGPSGNNSDINTYSSSYVKNYYMNESGITYE